LLGQGFSIQSSPTPRLRQPWECTGSTSHAATTFGDTDRSSRPANNAAFEAYPLALSGGVGVAQEAVFPMMNASENLNAAGILVEARPENGNVHASSIMQLRRSAMDSSARTIWLLSDPDSEVRRDRCLSLLMEQLEQQRRFLKINDDNVNRGPNPPPADCGRSSVQESCLTRCPLLRTRRASAANGSMCEVIP
jgi:hypothetical protein